MKWENYTNDRLIAKHDSGFYVIVPKTLKESTPIFCPVCSFIMNSTYDEESYRDFKCCDDCSSEWARRNKESWQSGWRPSQDDIKTVVDRRKESCT